MLKQLYTLTFVILFAVVLFGQSQPQISKRAPQIFNEPVTNVVVPPTTNNPIPAGWVLIDTMGNSYGPASPTLNPLYFEPYSGVLAFVHRGGGAVGTTSGRIYYNYSTDFGATWTRTATAVNEGNTQWAGRYPSMAIANPTQGTDINSTLAVFSWPELNPGAFGWLGFAADQPVGGNSPASGIDQGPPTYSSNMPTFVSYTTDNVFWLSDNQDNASLRFFRTADFSTIDKIDPPEWSDAIFQSNGNITLGGATRPGITVVAEFGPFQLQNPIQSGWTVGISKSTDEGTTWSAFNVCDFRTIPVLAAYDRLFDAKKNDTFVGFTGDIVLDDEGKAHLVVVVTDTVPSIDYPNNYGKNAIVELIETATGWDAKVIYDGIDNDIFTLYNNADNNPGIGQMSEGAFITVSEDGNFYLAQWIDKHPTVDTLCAVYYSYRTKTTNWSAKALLTESNTHNFNGAHLAPKVRKVDANKYMTFHMLWYQLGTDVSPIVTTAANGAYAKALETTVSGTDVNDNDIVTTFELGQNYPNPFNPVTNITYSVPLKGNVSIKVYDVLGNEVANLFNGIQESGTHTVSFNANSLASGMYLYTITAGNFTATKKMMLMK